MSPRGKGRPDDSRTPSGACPGKRAWGRTGEKELSQHEGGEDRLGVMLYRTREGAVSPWPGNETGRIRPGLTSWPRDDTPQGLLNQDCGTALQVPRGMEGRLRNGKLSCLPPGGLVFVGGRQAAGGQGGKPRVASRQQCRQSTGVSEGRKASRVQR